MNSAVTHTQLTHTCTQAGDLLISVNGVLTEHISLDEIRHHIGGPVNTQIAVQIQGRDGVIKVLVPVHCFIFKIANILLHLRHVQPEYWIDAQSTTLPFKLTCAVIQLI